MDPNKNTASFLIRFTQKLWEDESGDSQVQWRGNIKHVQDGGTQNFVDFEDAIGFIQSSLTSLTLNNIKEKDKKDKDNVLVKSFQIWRKFTNDSTQKVISTIKDPIGQLDELKSQVSDMVEQRVKSSTTWIPSTRSDNQEIIEGIQSLQKELVKMNKRLNAIEKKG